MHSRSRLEFLVPPGNKRFMTRVAFDNQVLSLPVRGLVDVRVEVDGIVAFERRSMRAGEPAVATGAIAVKPGQTLSLVVDFGLGRDIKNHID